MTTLSNPETLIADLIALAPDPRPRARTRHARLHRDGVLSALRRALDVGRARYSRHGGGVANCYGYPADTTGVALVAIHRSEEDLLVVGVGSAALPANKVTHAGVVAACVGRARSGAWWGWTRGWVRSDAALLDDLDRPISITVATVRQAVEMADYGDGADLAEAAACRAMATALAATGR